MNTISSITNASISLATLQLLSIICKHVLHRFSLSFTSSHTCLFHIAHCPNCMGQFKCYNVWNFVNLHSGTSTIIPRLNLINPFYHAFIMYFTSSYHFTDFCTYTQTRNMNFTICPVQISLQLFFPLFQTFSIPWKILGYWGWGYVTVNSK